MTNFTMGILCGCLTVFLRYLIGLGHDQFNPADLFASYTVFLSERRLKIMGALKDLYRDYMNSMTGCHTDAERAHVRMDYKVMLHNQAAPLFTWERAAGMCAVCSGVWLGMVGWAFFEWFLPHPGPGIKHFFDFLIIILTSHVSIRLLNKVL